MSDVRSVAQELFQQVIEYKPYDGASRGVIFFDQLHDNHEYTVYKNIFTGQVIARSRRVICDGTVRPASRVAGELVIANPQQLEFFFQITRLFEWVPFNEDVAAEEGIDDEEEWDGDKNLLGTLWFQGTAPVPHQWWWVPPTNSATANYCKGWIPRNDFGTLAEAAQRVWNAVN